MTIIAKIPARIYQPAKSTMQSGKAHLGEWLLEYMSPTAKKPDPLMGWQGGASTQSQVRLKFKDQASAEAYAKKKELDYTVVADNPRALILQTYAENFL